MSEATHAPAQLQNVHYDVSLPIMDREQIDMLMMGDDEEMDTSLVRELFGLFSEDSSAKLAALPEVCACGDLAQLRRIVHFVAGSAGNLGLMRLAAFYRAIERSIEDQTLTDISTAEGPIRREFEIGLEAFRSGFNL